MTEIQLAFVAGLVLAAIANAAQDRPDWRLSALFGVNLLASIFATHDMMSLGLLDLSCATVAIIIATRRGYILAGLYAAMGATYAAGVLQMMPMTATYGIVEVLCVACLGVISGADRWIKRRRDTSNRSSGGNANGRGFAFGPGGQVVARASKEGCSR